jgi:hypothetical protein
MFTILSPKFFFCAIMLLKAVASSAREVGDTVGAIVGAVDAHCDSAHSHIFLLATTNILSMNPLKGDLCCPQGSVWKVAHFTTPCRMGTTPSQHFSIQV